MCERGEISMAVRYAEDIIKKIRARGAISLPADGICGEAFEKWLCESVMCESEEFNVMFPEVDNVVEVDNIYIDDYDYGEAA